MTITLRERLEELELDPTGTDMLDLDALLRACGFTCYDHGDILVYRHDRWRSLETFPRTSRTVPVTRLVRILREVRAHLQREGSL